MASILLYTYDSNSDLLPSEVTEKDLLGRQQALITHLRNEEYKISDIWVGGEGNKEQGYGICLEVTAKWVEEVGKAGRSEFK